MAEDNKLEDEMVPVGDGVEEEKPVVITEEVKPEEEILEVEGEQKLDAEDDDKRIGGGEAEDDDKREARKAERKSRRTRQKVARNRDQVELKFLRQRNEQVERQINELSARLDQSDATTVDSRMNQIKGAIKNADSVLAKAISAGEGEDAAEAQNIRDGLRDQLGQLERYQETAAYQTEQAQKQAEDPPNPLVMERVKAWHENNSWYHFGRQDEDSAIVGAIDDMLIRDGYDPTSQEYYDELDSRIARRLPHKATGDDDRGNGQDLDEDRPAKTPAGPKFRVGGRERTLKSNEVHISRERREAMEQAGMWEDPVLRNKQLKRYAEWDRENA